MPTQTFSRRFTSLFPTRKPKLKAPVAMHSMLLMLEPRMVFDASIPAAAEAVDTSVDMPVQAQMEEMSPLSAPPLPDGEWSAPSEVVFSGSFTVDEDDTLALGGKITIIDPDSDYFRVTITVDTGTLSLTYVPGLKDNEYHWISDQEVWFEADAETIQKALDTLTYTGGKYYNGSATLSVIVDDGFNHEQAFEQVITIISVPNAPEFQDLPAGSRPNSPLEDIEMPLLFEYGPGDWRSLRIWDPDSNDSDFDDTYNLTLTITNGTLSSTYGALSLDSCTEIDHTRTYTLAGLTLEEVNGILADLRFLGDQDYNGKAGFIVDIFDIKADESLRREFTGDYAIDVLPVNDPPTLNPAASWDTSHQLHVKETGPGSEAIFNLSHFHIEWNETDWPITNGGNDFISLFDVDNNLHQLVIQIESVPTQGELWRKIGDVWVKLAEGSTFSLWDVYSGRVKYAHNPDIQVRDTVNPGSEQDAFIFLVNDGAGSELSIVSGLAMHIVLEPVNQPPSVVTGGTVWGYEGQQGIIYTFDVIDPDQAPDNDFIIQFTELPDEASGFFWYDDGNGSGYQKVTAANMATLELSLERIQAGYLRFCHSGAEDYEPGGGNISFKISVTDDGGGEGKPLTTEAIMSLNIRPNNDHPEWDASVADRWDNPEHTHTISLEPGDRVVGLIDSIFNVTDKDSARQTLTYTITEISGNGQLLYYLGEAEEGKPRYRLLVENDKITQVDIDNGKIFWRFDGEGDQEADIRFIVRDGSITACPVPPDQDQPLPYPFTDTSASGWEHGSGPHEGGIGAWIDTGSGYEWVLTEHTLHIAATDILPGETIVPETYIDPVPAFDRQDTPLAVVEGQTITFSGDTLHAWFYEKQDPETDITGNEEYPSATGYNLTYRIEDLPAHGWILYGHDDGHGGTTYSVLGLHGSFTQADVDAGKILYLHDSTEHFADSFAFSVSDGRTEVVNSQNGGNTFAQQLVIEPRNDSPVASTGIPLQVNEHDLPYGESADHTTPGGEAILTLEHIKISDPDRGSLGSELDPGGFSNPNDLCIIITQLPDHGTLWYQTAPGVWVDVVPVNPADIDAIKDGGGWITWDTDEAITDNSFTRITLQDIIDGNFKYQHSGEEAFYDAFAYLVSDNKGITATDPAHNSYTLAGNQIVLVDRNQASICQHEQEVNIIVRPVNDKPEREPGFEDIAGIEGQTITITNSNIKYFDPDGTPEAIQFILTTLPEHGVLLLNGKVLGVDSVFTQADVDAGRVQYRHDGTENHADSFKCHVSDSIFTSAADSEVFYIDIMPMNVAPAIKVPADLYVNSITGGVMLNQIIVTDADYTGTGLYPGSGIEYDHLTVEIDISTSADVDLDLVEILFKAPLNADNITISSPEDIGGGVKRITIVGNYEEINNVLSAVTVRTRETSPGTFYDPNGDIRLHITVHDGIWNGSEWIHPNGGGGEVYEATGDVRVYISPTNNPPSVVNADDGHTLAMTILEDAAYTLVTDDNGDPLHIEDLDAFNLPRNSITLTVEHGTLLVNDYGSTNIVGKGSNTLTISGTLAQINTVLATLQYRPDADFNGEEVIRFTYKDGGNTGDPPDDITLNEDTVDGLLNTPYQYMVSEGVFGLAVNGQFIITVEPVNDAPTITAPTDLYIKKDFIFNGIVQDILGNTGLILLDDVDISVPAAFFDDNIRVEIVVTAGTLAIIDDDPLLSGVIPSSLIQAGGSGTTTLTLEGTLADVNEALTRIQYIPDVWSASTNTLTVTVTDPGTNGNATNGAPGGMPLKAVHVITLHSKDVNYPADIDVTDWSIFEDDEMTKIFDITITDPDSFDAKIYASLHVESGTLDISDAKGLLNLSGNPALQDAIELSADGKTVYIKASLDKINAVLTELQYKPDANVNGDIPVTIYVHDLGFTGEFTGSETPVEDNPIGVTGSGLATTLEHYIHVVPINDAPTVLVSNVNFWGADSADQVWEDTTDAAGLKPRSVSDLFIPAFSDALDDQPAYPNGSKADTLAGIVVVGNAATSAQGEWQYYDTLSLAWVNIGSHTAATGLFLAEDVQLRFAPEPDFNGQPGQLTVHLVDSSDPDEAHGSPDLPVTGDMVDLTATGTGGITRYSQDSVTLITFIQAINDAPTVKAGEEAQTWIINEDQSPDRTVNDIFGASFSDAADKQDHIAVVGGSTANDFAGIVIVDNADTANGVWEYRIGGGDWTELPSDLSLAKGLFLGINDSLRFVPAADWNSTSLHEALTVHLVDDSDSDTTHGNPTLSAAGGYVDLSVGKGGNTRYSDASVLLTIGVTTVNDAPVIVGGNEANLETIMEDENPADNSGDTVFNVFNGHFNDDKDEVADAGGSHANALEGVLIVGNAANPDTQGRWQYSTDGGTTWIDIPTSTELVGKVFALQQDWRIRFDPIEDFNGNPGKLTVRLIDNSDEVASGEFANPAAVYGGAGFAAPPFGGASRYSADTMTLGIFVEPENDAPEVIPTVSPFTLTEDTPWTGTVDDLFDRYYSDAKDNQQAAGGEHASTADDFEGVFITHNEATSAQGVWQYSLDDGEHWIPIPSTGELAGQWLYLSKDTPLRFVPKLDYNGPLGILQAHLMEHYDGADGEGHLLEYYISGELYDDLSDIIGGHEHISLLEAIIDISIGAVNDAPVATTPTIPVDLLSISEDPAVNSGEKVEDLFIARFTDSKDEVPGGLGTHANLLAGILVRDVPSGAEADKGTWQYYDTGTSTWKPLAVGMFIQAGDSIRFSPAEDFNGTATGLTVFLVEDSGAFVDTPPVSGTTHDYNFTADGPFTEDYLQVRITVNAINDSPVITGGKPLTVPLDSIIEDVISDNNAGNSIGDLLDGYFNDDRDNQYDPITNPDGSDADTFIGVWVETVGLEPLAGAWQYESAPDVWQDIEPGMFLEENVAIRFQPVADYNSQTDPGADQAKPPVPDLKVRLVESIGIDCDLTTGNVYTAEELTHADAGSAPRYTTGPMGLISFAIEVIAENDPPTILGFDAGPGGSPIDRLEVDEDTPLAFIGINSIQFDDVDVNERTPGELLVILTVEHGTLTLGSTAEITGYTAGGGANITIHGSLTDINAAMLTLQYQGLLDYNGLDTLHVFVSDQGYSSALGELSVPATAEKDIYLQVMPVNDAPVAKDGVTSVDFWAGGLGDWEDVGESATGKTIAEIFGDIFDDSKDDQTHYPGTDIPNPEGSETDELYGIVTTSSGSGAEGDWQYSLDNGATWKLVSDASPSADNALFLGLDAQLRFVPAEDFNGAPPALKVHLVETKGGAPLTSGSSIDASSVGGSSRFSTELGLHIHIRPVNDAPAVVGGSTATLEAIDEDVDSADNGGQTVADIFGSHFNDDKDEVTTGTGGSHKDLFAGVLVVGNAATITQGVWEYSITDTDDIWIEIPVPDSGQGFALKAGWYVRFRPAPDWNGTPGDLTVRLIDSSAVVDSGPYPNPAAIYGAVFDLPAVFEPYGRYSLTEMTLGITVNAVNDAPATISGNDETQTLAAIDEDEFDSHGQSVRSLFAEFFSDAKDAVPTSDDADDFAGVLVIGNAAVTTQGVWQYNDGDPANPVDWHDIPAFSAGQGVALKADWAIRFVPKPDWNGVPGDLTVRLIDTSATVDSGPYMNPVADWGQAATINAVGGATRYSTQTITLSTSVNAVNDAPSTISGNDETQTLAAIDEDEFDSHGQSVRSLFAEFFSDARDAVPTPDDADDFAGVLVVGNAAASAQGVWQYNDGNPAESGDWHDIPVMFAANQGFALKADWAIRFVPKPDWNGVPGDLTVRLIDTSATVDSGPYMNPAADWGQVAAIDAVGGVTRYSTQTITLSTSVNAVNDAPHIIGDGDAVLDAIDEDTFTSPGDTIQNLFASRYDDTIDDPVSGMGGDPFAGVLVVGNAAASAQGVWQYNDGDPAEPDDWHDIPVTFAANQGFALKADWSIRFVPKPDWNGNAGKLTVRLIDASASVVSGPFLNPEAVWGNMAIVSTVGGVTRYSSDTLQLAHTVHPVNDAPFWNMAAFTPAPEHGSGFAGYPAAYLYFGHVAATDYSEVKTVADALKGSTAVSAFLDTRDEVEGGSSANTLLGILVTGIHDPLGLGVWQYNNGDPDNPTDWHDITFVSEASALFLSADTHIRFHYDDGVDIPIDTPPHSGLAIALVDDSDGSNGWTTGNTKDISGGNRGGITPVSEDSMPLWATVLPYNYYPEFIAGIDDPTTITAATVTEGQLGQLSNSLQISDKNLDYPGTGTKWAGSGITIQRDGAANSEDTFAVWDDKLSSLAEGDSFSYDSTLCGTVIKNSGGILQLRFTEPVDRTMVDNVLHAIGYTNTSKDPDPAITLQWIIDDGNYQQSNNTFQQGRNRLDDSSGTTSYTQTVNIILVNDQPEANPDIGVFSIGTQTQITGNVLLNDTDPDRDATLSVDSFEYTDPDTLAETGGIFGLPLEGKYGYLTLESDGNYTYELKTDAATEESLAQLGEGQFLEDIFAYRARDDGHWYNAAEPALVSNTTTLTIQLLRPVRAVPAANLLDLLREPSVYVPDSPTGSHTDRPPLTLATDTPVVREVQTLRDALAVSVQESMKKLGNALHSHTVYLTDHDLEYTFLTEQDQSFRLPKLFRHSHGQRLSHAVTLKDGSPLPAWLSWDEDRLVLSGKPLQSLTSPLVIKIVARDQSNNSATTHVYLYVEDAEPEEEQVPQASTTPARTHNDNLDLEDADGIQTEHPSAANFAFPGGIGLNEQIAQSGQQAFFYNAMQCIHKLHV